MGSLNMWSGTGRLGRDAELRHVGADGTPLMTFSMAVDIPTKKDGKWDNDTMWVKVDLWGRRAETIYEWFPKGTRAAVSGPIKLEEYTRKDGTLGYSLVCRATSVETMETRRERENKSGQVDELADPSWRSSAPSTSDDDIPF